VLWLQEYGLGRLSKKHSTFFAAMMRELGLCDTPERYLAHVPWQVRDITIGVYLLSISQNYEYLTCDPLTQRTHHQLHLVAINH
jgi:hypothetical protein